MPSAIISSRAQIKPFIEQAVNAYEEAGIAVCIASLRKTILSKKVRFPILEYVGQQLYADILLEEQVVLMEGIVDLDIVGGYVLAGMILQMRLSQRFKESIGLAVQYIIRGDKWYVCDIIGERVMGHALLTYPEKTIPVLNSFAVHPDKWIVRSIGVATHYAVKNGLKKKYVGEVFVLLLQLAGTTDFHTKKGIGWGAKTIAKFHPEIIDKYCREIDNAEVKQWFRTKIKIGLGRKEKYANRYTG